MSITTHILDTSSGTPAKAVVVRLERLFPESPSTLIAKGITNDDGRIPNFVSSNTQIEAGTYKIIFEVKPYFEAQKRASFFPVVEIFFEIIEPNRHYHVPLLISGFGYSTYRGS